MNSLSKVNYLMNVDEMDFINYFVKRKNGQLELANRSLNT